MRHDGLLLIGQVHVTLSTLSPSSPALASPALLAAAWRPRP
jgi:hypothetical protein